jgi:hypothetical protein
MVMQMNDEGTPRPAPSRIAGAPDPQLAGVEQRLTALEKKAPSLAESRFLRFGAIAGVLGTLMSIGTGALQFYSGTVRHRSELQQKAEHTFEGYIQQLNSNVEKVMTVYAGNESPSVKFSQTAPIFSDIYVATISAVRLLPSVKPTYEQFFTLAEATAIHGDYSDAREYFQKAVASSSGLERAEVLRAQGQILVRTGDQNDIATALSGYRQAFDLAKTEHATSPIKANILNDWLIESAYVGDCGEAANLFDMLLC